MSFTQQTPVVRDFRELQYLERSLVMAYMGLAIDAKFIIDEFLQHDPHTQMFLAWLEDTVKHDIQLGSCFYLEYRRIMDSDSVTDINLYHPQTVEDKQ